MNKKCSTCGETRDLKFFDKNKDCKDGHVNQCRKCRYKKTIEIRTDKTKSYNTSEYRRQASIRFRENNLENQIFLSTRSRAKRRGIDFNIELTDIVIPEYCPYLNIKITRSVGIGRQDSNPSIDRVDNSKGYVKGNIEIISDLANRMKLNSSYELLLIFAENIILRHKKNHS